MLARIASLTLLALAVAAPAALANPWLERRVLHMAHQGGEYESPSNTFFAYKRALANGADMLEVDVNITADRELIVFHDTTLQGRTNGSGRVNQTKLADIKKLDAAYTFQRGPDGKGKYAGIATGHVDPPKGYTAEDFQVPTLRELLTAYPDLLMNIEIKGPAPDTAEPHNWAQQSIAGDPTAVDAAVELAEVLNEFGRKTDTIVVSFSDTALQRFKADAPETHTAAGLATTALFYATAAEAAPGAPSPRNVALQPPTNFQGLVDVPSKDFVDNAHANGLAVHVWMGAGEEDDADGGMDAVYDALIDAGVDGIMTDRPSRLEAALERRGVRYDEAKSKRAKAQKAKKARAKQRKRAARRR